MSAEEVRARVVGGRRGGGGGGEVGRRRRRCGVGHEFRPHLDVLRHTTSDGSNLARQDMKRKLVKYKLFKNMFYVHPTRSDL